MRKMRYFLFLTSTFLFSLGSPSAEKVIRIYTYHGSPPFIIDQNRQIGITYGLASYLETHSAGKYKFKVHLLPRKRLDMNLPSFRNFLIPWTNPLWFKGVKLPTGEWTHSYVDFPNCLAHKNEIGLSKDIISNLEGMQIAGLRGGKWVTIEPHIKEKNIKKVDVNDYLSGLGMLKQGRVDFALVPEIVFEFYKKKNHIQDMTCTRTGDPSFRHAFVSGNKDLRDYIVSQFEILSKNGKIESFLSSRLPD